MFMSQLIMDNNELLECPMFVNMYNESKDYPWFENHLFILFKCNTIKQVDQLDQMLERNRNFYNRYSIRIDVLLQNIKSQSLSYGSILTELI